MPSNPKRTIRILWIRYRIRPLEGSHGTVSENKGMLYVVKL